MANSTLQSATNYAVSSKIEPFYRGGKVQISKDEKYIFCICGTRVNVLEIGTGKIFTSVEQEDQEDITSFVVSPDDEMLVTASRALLLTQWDWRSQARMRSWRAVHTAPVASMSFDPTSTLLATGGCDSTIKIWDVLKQYCTHNLKGSSGVVHLVQFHPDTSRLQLFSSAADYVVRIWDLRSSRCVCVLEAHYSAVTSLAFSHHSDTLVSSGRDKVCVVWDLKSCAAIRTVPVYEAVEAAVVLPEGEVFPQIGVKSEGLHFMTAGSKGVLRVWEASSARCVFAQTPSVAPPSSRKEEGGDEANQLSLTYLLDLPASGRLATVTAEHNILLYDMPSLSVRQQFVGYNDEVLDVRFLGKRGSHIVVATNSPQIKVFELETSSCQILYGHTDTVLALDVFHKGMMFVSCAKDRTVRVWLMHSETGRVSCMGQGSSHVDAVGSVTCSRLKEAFLVSGSQDCTLKVWDLPAGLASNPDDSSPKQLLPRATEKGHDKDINSVTVSPNDKLVASGSQDRTAKLWALADLSLLGVFRGHRRGVWCVQFSPMDQVLASSSADGSVRLWGLQDFSCLKTFEGHDASVLKVIFVSRGTQLLTSGSDGLIKLWTIKTNECIKTLDAHQDKVWGLHANAKSGLVVSGSADSNIILWTDVTEAELAEEQAKQDEQILKQQELSNLLHEGNYLKALGIAISLGHPQTVLRVIKEVRLGEGGTQQLEETVLKLRQDQKEALLSYCVVWNTNGRSCLDAQAVVQVLLRHESPEQLLRYQGVRPALEGLLPYTERHMQRVGRLLQASMFLDFLWEKMRVAAESSVGMHDEEMENAPPLPFHIDRQPDLKAGPGSCGEEEEEGHSEEESAASEDDEAKDCRPAGKGCPVGGSTGSEESASEEEDLVESRDMGAQKKSRTDPQLRHPLAR
ncbi:transducin beta-like protein 3 [Paramormyrops kingsleyae]|uniref:Transducin beta like 3 n=1 Tax=Paramormyrops kingsleyae TaxID=1676925 RepID=A0A3B3R3P3_9TELE|nr:transducin beta-like protein 3 [Paramormyrops kingsleyae]